MGPRSNEKIITNASILLSCHMLPILSVKVFCSNTGIYTSTCTMDDLIQLVQLFEDLSLKKNCIEEIKKQEIWRDEGAQHFIRAGRVSYQLRQRKRRSCCRDGFHHYMENSMVKEKNEGHLKNASISTYPGLTKDTTNQHFIFPSLFYFCHPLGPRALGLMKL